MDKKILLGGASALLLVGNMYVTPANAAIDLSIGGEAKLTAGMSECGPAATNNGTNIGDIMRDITAGAVADGASAAATGAAIEAINTDMTAGANDIVESTALDVAAGPCAGADRNGIDWGFGKELSIGAEGTLANGLEVSFSDTLDLTDTNAEVGAFELVLGSAVGTLTFKEGGGDAVGKARVAGDADVDVNGTNLGFHGSKTTGHGGMGILWQAPSVGDLDLYVGWSPNSGGDGLDDAAYENTFSVAAVMGVGDMTIGAGYAAANATTGNGCAAVATIVASEAASTFVDNIYGGDYCGDQTLMHIAADMSVGDIGLGLGYSVQDTDEADKTVWHVAASTSLSGYDIDVTYRDTNKDYEFGDAEDTQTVVAVSLGTSLGDGVDLGLSFSTADTELASQLTDDNYYFAEASLTVGF
jgi:hypothetical protein